MVNKIEKAVNFAMEKHKNQLDDDGHNYFITHVLKVYETLKEITNDEATLIAGLLHDTIEDTNATYGELTGGFGREIADLVMELTQEGEKDEYGYYFPRLKSKKAIMVKLADRLSNISRMDSWGEKRQKQYLKKSKFWKDGSDIVKLEMWECEKCNKTFYDKKEAEKCCTNPKMAKCSLCGNLEEDDYTYVCTECSHKLIHKSSDNVEIICGVDKYRCETCIHRDWESGKKSEKGCNAVWDKENKCWNEKPSDKVCMPYHVCKCGHGMNQHPGGEEVCTSLHCSECKGFDCKECSDNMKVSRSNDIKNDKVTRSNGIEKGSPNFELQHTSQNHVKDWIKHCEGKHIQQVCYSTYHDAFTQVCFGCKIIRTNLEDIKNER